MVKKKADKTDKTYVTALRIIFAASFVLVGLYYELCSAVISAALIGLLIWKTRDDGWKVHLNSTLAAVGITAVFYLLSSFYGVDSGLAVWGFVKYLVVPLFLLCVMQCTKEERQIIINDIPGIGVIMTVSTFFLQFIPALNSSFSVDNRLAGFFQYPNTFACFLLIGIVILALDKTISKKKLLLCGSLLSFGLMQSGSRTVFLLSVPVLLAALLVNKKKQVIWMVLAGIAAGVLAAYAVSLLGIGGVDRASAISVSESTFLGRLLYWKDALPVILKHPFGLGYLGYYITEGSFQTGVYAVRWVHNDLLQIMLDTGWIPGILCAYTALKSIFVKRTPAVNRIALITLLAHCMTDFDLQFMSMYFVLMLCLNVDDGEEYSFDIPVLASIPAGCVLTLLSIYIGIASTLTYMEYHELASKIYPWNTISNIDKFSSVTTAEEMDALADKILDQNEYVSIAWSGKAMAAYSEGDFPSYITYKRKAIELDKYDINEYIEYYEVLKFAVSYYQYYGVSEGANMCLAEISYIQTLLDDLEENTDPLAFMLYDQPTFRMPYEYYEYLETEY